MEQSSDNILNDGYTLPPVKPKNELAPAGGLHIVPIGEASNADFFDPEVVENLPTESRNQLSAAWEVEFFYRRN